MDFVDQAEEGYYGLLSAVPRSRRLSSVYVDVGSGTTRLGCLLNDSDLANYHSADINYGSVSGRNEALKRNPGSFIAGVDSVVEEVSVTYKANARNVSCLRSPERIYWTGGAAWATATFMHPEDELSGWVVITRHDLDAFIARLEDGTWNQPPAFSLPKGMSPQQQRVIRQKAQKSIEDVQNVFVREDLLAGVSIMRSVLDSGTSTVSLRYVRNANYIFGYAAVKFDEHASLKIYSTLSADAPKYVIYRLSPPPKFKC